MCATACAARGQVQGAGFLFPLYVPRHGTQIIWLGGKHPDLLNHLARPESSFASSESLLGVISYYSFMFDTIISQPITKIFSVTTDT